MDQLRETVGGLIEELCVLAQHADGVLLFQHLRLEYLDEDLFIMLAHGIHSALFKLREFILTGSVAPLVAEIIKVLVSVQSIAIDALVLSRDGKVYQADCAHLIPRCHELVKPVETLISMYKEAWRHG